MDTVFAENIVPRMTALGIQNVVLRVYEHHPGFLDDNPVGGTELVFCPIGEMVNRVTELTDRYGQEKGIALTSVVSRRSDFCQLLLLDIQLPISLEHERWMKEHIRMWASALNGLAWAYLFRTDKSYHLLGIVPQTFFDWEADMQRAMLIRTKEMMSVFDVRYVAHSLLRRYGALRLNAYNREREPEFIEEFRSVGFLDLLSR